MSTSPFKRSRRTETNELRSTVGKLTEENFKETKITRGTGKARTENRRDERFEKKTKTCRKKLKLEKKIKPCKYF